MSRAQTIAQNLRAHGKQYMLGATTVEGRSEAEFYKLVRMEAEGEVFTPLGRKVRDILWKKTGRDPKKKYGLVIIDAGTEKLKKRDVDDTRGSYQTGGPTRLADISVSGTIFSAANAKFARLKSGDARVFEVGGKKYKVTTRPDRQLGYGDILVTTSPSISSKSYERIELKAALVAPSERGYRWVGSKSKKGHVNVASAIYAMLVEAPKGRLRVASKARATKVRVVKARVRKSGTKWLLKMGKGEALFSTKREAQGLADALNDMTPAKAREAMGLT